MTRREKLKEIQSGIQGHDETGDDERNAVDKIERRPAERIKDHAGAHVFRVFGIHFARTRDFLASQQSSAHLFPDPHEPKP